MCNKNVEIGLQNAVFHLCHSGPHCSSDRYLLFGKRPLAIAEINAELPPFKNREHKFESASTIDCDITLLKK